MLVAWLLVCAAVLQPAAVDVTVSGVVVLTAVLLVAMAMAAAVILPRATTRALTVAPACRRLRGRFLQQSRPGVPGRVRSRAPGYGH